MAEPALSVRFHGAQRLVTAHAANGANLAQGFLVAARRVGGQGGCLADHVDASGATHRGLRVLVGGLGVEVDELAGHDEVARDDVAVGARQGRQGTRGVSVELLGTHAGRNGRLIAVRGHVFLSRGVVLVVRVLAAVVAARTTAIATIVTEAATSVVTTLIATTPTILATEPSTLTAVVEATPAVIASLIATTVAVAAVITSATIIATAKLPTIVIATLETAVPLTTLIATTSIIATLVTPTLTASIIAAAEVTTFPITTLVVAVCAAVITPATIIATLVTPTLTALTPLRLTLRVVTTAESAASLSLFCHGAKPLFLRSLALLSVVRTKRVQLPNVRRRLAWWVWWGCERRGTARRVAYRPSLCACVVAVSYSPTTCRVQYHWRCRA